MDKTAQATGSSSSIGRDPAPQKPSIQLRLQEMANMLGRLHRNIHELQDRLNPVLCSPDHPEPKDMGDPPETSNIMGIIDMHTIVIEHECNRLESVMGRLQL